MVYTLFQNIGERIRRWYRWFIVKFFKRPLTVTELDAEFLRKASKMTYDGTVKVHTGGLQVFQNLMYDQSNIVYFLVIRKRTRRKSINLRRWFQEYGKDRKW
ncbi:hypothetical protein LCGC14_2626040 [marine sediment metagenome]|uniref:Uncharacterized protein n=1 Tax=marine sediment metagenome TaxID=412755 RepID=A0A0F9A1K5_9ZZZZ